ncbi:MAG TPA: alpha-amylase family glycosyl hydrolase [Acidobacteriaceae bacterium]
MEFHISRAARSRYQTEQTLFSFNGNVIFADLRASRELAQRMNTVRGTENDPERVIHPGALFAMGLIDEASHLLIHHYRKSIAPRAMAEALQWFSSRLGAERFDELLLRFVQEFPGSMVYRGEETAQEWLNGSTDGQPHREAAFEELMMLWLANANPAFRKFIELFDEKPLTKETPYPKVTSGLHDFFATKPPIGDEAANLIDVLRAPALASPDSLSGQLAFIREKWSRIVGDAALRRLLLAIDVLKEEDVAIWMRFHPADEMAERRRRGRRGHAGDFGRVDLPDFAVMQHEYERFSPDQDWMPSTVLIAKSTYVWLAQLSKRYSRSITRLDQIPDEELATLAGRGMNSLWLIGLWERSRASRTIKHLCGKEDAVASAYSLYDYRIADDLGGYDAYIRLRDQAWRFGIRLASDMVPNHMGIDSPWVIEHPEWFLSRYDSPYPAYSFNGPDLSSDGRVEIKIEDHYYEQSDAAVVFRRRDKWTGDTRYVYHGNDGTSFPWNDTAQLDYLNPAVREQVIQTILHVARLFPIIRFDAAMTLAKRHIQRLWYPVPGAGGAIPSRAEYSMPTSEFDKRIPVEFWREVVDRVAAEVPGTLLLAEAFWMMEGYFVRTLGMHRVYNSAFMNLLRDEDNQHYRGLLKQTMEFDPGIMKRYVNFMSNPDERTAIDQFGTGDKCFGIATMMATLPGLPMFGHGQVEGFTEKYGMEYQRPRYDETPNQWLVDRHNREIAPLLHSRWLFAESDNFLLYDFWKDDGTVDENVYGYSNARGGQRALVLYNNRYSETHGTIHHSTGFIDKVNGGLRQRSLQDGLHLPTDHEVILAFRDVSNGLEYLRRASDLHQKGFSFHLSAYKYHVFLHWRELRASREYPWDRLHDSLHGAGVPNLDEALDQLRLQPLHDALRAALDPAILAGIIDAAEMEATGAIAVRQRERRILEAVEPFIDRGNRFQKMAKQMELERAAGAHLNVQSEGVPQHSELLVATLALPRYEALFPKRWSETARKVLPSDSPGTSGTAVWAPVLAWSLLRGLPLDGMSVFDRLRLRHALADVFHALGMSGEDSWRAAARVRFLLYRDNPLLLELSHREWQDGDVQWLTGTHTSDGVRYFNKESHEELLWWIQVPGLVAATPAEQRTAAQRSAAAVSRATQAAKDAGYRLDVLLTGERSGGDKSLGAAVKPARKTKAKSTSSQDGAGSPRVEEKASTAKKKRTTKKSTPGKRKP